MSFEKRVRLVGFAWLAVRLSFLPAFAYAAFQLVVRHSDPGLAFMILPGTAATCFGLCIVAYPREFAAVLLKGRKDTGEYDDRFFRVWGVAVALIGASFIWQGLH